MQAPGRATHRGTRVTIRRSRAVWISFSGIAHSFRRKEKGENDGACRQLGMTLEHVFSVSIFFGRFGGRSMV